MGSFLFKIAFTKVHYTHQSTLDAVLCHQMERVGMLSERQEAALEASFKSSQGY